jgi:nitric oxide reductase activation protein
METGRIDRRLVAELGFGNDHVFTQTIHNTVTPSLIHISVDASGSMNGSKWDAAMKTSVAIAKAASMISSMDVVISARGTMGNYNTQTPLMWVIYDSRKDKFEQFRHKAYAVCEGGSTPEGLCFQAVMKEIIASANGKEMYFINISDGEPGYSDSNIQYGGDYANKHTKAQVDKMRKNGIKVLSYFVSEGSYGMDRSRTRFQEMYGKDAEMIDINNLTQLSLSLNKLFVRNV